MSDANLLTSICVTAFWTHTLKHWKHTHTHIFTYARIISIYACIHTPTNVHVHTHICMHTYSYICMYVCVPTHYLLMHTLNIIKKTYIRYKKLKCKNKKERGTGSSGKMREIHSHSLSFCSFWIVYHIHVLASQRVNEIKSIPENYKHT